MINVGWIVMTLRTYQSLDTAKQAMDLLSSKIGTVIFLLGLMHFFNLFLFNRFRRRALDRLITAPPPVAPTHHLTPVAPAR